jgi:hypothetical protein
MIIFLQKWETRCKITPQIVHVLFIEAQRSIEIFTGFDKDSLKLTFLHCGIKKEYETIPFHDIHTRYVKLSHVFGNTKFTMSEVEVYGVLGKKQK